MGKLFEDNAASRLYQQYQADLKELQETCLHVEITQPMGEMTSDARNRTGRTVQICLECNKVVKFTAYCQQCWAKGQGWPPWEHNVSKRPRSRKEKEESPPSTRLDETTAFIDPQRTYRGYLCAACLVEVPERDRDHRWPREVDES